MTLKIIAFPVALGDLTRAPARDTFSAPGSTSLRRWRAASQEHRTPPPLPPHPPPPAVPAGVCEFGATPPNSQWKEEHPSALGRASAPLKHPEEGNVQHRETGGAGTLHLLLSRSTHGEVRLQQNRYFSTEKGRESETRTSEVTLH